MSLLMRLSVVCSLFLVPMADAQAAGLFDDAFKQFKKDVGELTDTVTGKSKEAITPAAPSTIPAPAQEVVYNKVPDRVAQVQGLLAQLGYPVGIVDGAYGPGTRAAIQRFQADRGLPQFGNVTASLIQALQNAVQIAGGTIETAPLQLPAQTGVAPTLDTPKYEGVWVRELQQRLTQAGLNPGPIDGAFGNGTSNAIAAFQKQAGLVPDGMPRPSVMTSLRAQTGGSQIAGGAPLPGGSQPAPVDLASYESAQPVAGMSDHEYLLLRHVQANPNVVNEERFINGFAMRGCTVEAKSAKQNAITLNNFKNKVRADAKAFSTRAQAMQVAPAKLSIEVDLLLSDYDFNAGGFTYIRGQNPGIVEATNCKSNSLGPAEKYPSGFRFTDQDGGAYDAQRIAETLALLPMTQEQALTFLGGKTGKRVTVQIDFVVGPQPPMAKTIYNGTRTVESVVVRADVRDKETGQSLRSYEPELFLPEVSEPQSFVGGVTAPTYDRLMEAYLATHKEVVDDQDFVLAYLSYIPSNAACANEYELLDGDEFSKRQFFDQVLPSWKSGFDQTVAVARAPGDNEVFRASIKATAGEYAFDDQSFPIIFPPNNGGMLTVSVSTQDSFGNNKSSKRKFCRKSSFYHMPTRVFVRFSNLDKLKNLPMGVEAAADFRTRNPKRELGLSVDFVLETIERNGRESNATARIVGTNVLDGNNEQSLYRFDRAVFAPPPTDPWEGYPEPSHAELLLALVGRSPELAQNDTAVLSYINDRACEALAKTYNDEVARNQMIAKWRPRLLAAAANAAETSQGFVRVAVAQRLGLYDSNKGRIPFQNRELSRDAPKLFRIKSRSCSNDPIWSFSVLVEPPLTLLDTGLPVTEEVAGLILAPYQGFQPWLEFELLLALGSPGAVNSNNQSITPGKIVNARVRGIEPGTYERTEVLYEYGSAFFEAGAPVADAFIGVKRLVAEDLMLAYLRARPDLAQDASFVKNYAATIQCEALRETASNEIRRAAVLAEFQQSLLGKIEQVADDVGTGTYRISLPAYLGSYDTGEQKFPLTLATLPERYYSDLFPEPTSAFVLDNSLHSACRKEAVDQSRYPAGFLIPMGSAVWLGASGLPMETSKAAAFLDGEGKPNGRPHTFVNLEMVIQVAFAATATKGNNHNYLGVSLVDAEIQAARAVEPGSGLVLHDFDVSNVAAAEPIVAKPSFSPEMLPKGTKYVQVTMADVGDIKHYALLTDSGIEGMTGEFQGKSVREISDERMLEYVRQGQGVLMSVAQFALAYEELEPLGIHMEPFESPADALARRIAETESGGPYGPEMSGLQLGMSFATAEQVIRSQMDVGWVFQMARDKALGVQAMSPHNSGLVFVAKDGSQVFGIFDEPPAADGIVLGAWRRANIQDPNILEQDILAILTETYGEQTPYAGYWTGWLWGKTVNDPTCLPRGRAQVGRNLIEGPSLDSEDGQRMMQKSNSVIRTRNAKIAMFDPGLPPDVTRLDSCGPFISAEMVRDKQFASYLDIVLLDYGHYSRRYVESYETLRSGGTESLKAVSKLLGGPAKSDLVVETKAESATAPVVTTATVQTTVEPVAAPTAEIAAMATLPTPAGADDERGATAFKILDISVGMAKEDALLAMANEFAPDQITPDLATGALLGERGNCGYGDPAAPSIAAEAGSFCLRVEFSDKEVTGISLRQVIPGDVSDPALAAFEARYGKPIFAEEKAIGGATAQTLVGWGQAIGAERHAIDRTESPIPARVMEGSLWFGNGVSTIVLDLDKAAALSAPSAAVKF